MRQFRVALLVTAAALAGYGVGRHETAEDLKELDRQFDRDTAMAGAAGWASYFAEDGIMMPGGQDMVVGKKAILEYEQKAFSTPGFALRWEPIEAAASGDLGYTYGVYKVAHDDAQGKQVFSYGKYVTIWKKQRDRTWKVAIDIGNSSPPPEEHTESKSHE